MKNAKLFFVGLLFLIVCSTSLGALNAYLRLTGEMQGEIKGPVTQPGREDSILVIATSHELISPRDAASGLPTGKRQHNPFVITKELDISTVRLLFAMVNGENITDFEIQYWQPSPQGPEIQFYTIKLYNARICGIRQEMLNNKYPENMQHKEREHISFTYSKIEWEWVDGGDIVEDDWEFQQPHVLVTDLSGDGIVNVLDLAILANDWLAGTKPK